MANEIRLDENGNIDDVVIDCDSIHLERMDHNLWWLGVYRKEKRTAFHIVTGQSGVMVWLIENQLRVKKK